MEDFSFLHRFNWHCFLKLVKYYFRVKIAGICIDLKTVTTTFDCYEAVNNYFSYTIMLLFMFFQQKEIYFQSEFVMQLLKSSILRIRIIVFRTTWYLRCKSKNPLMIIFKCLEQHFHKRNLIACKFARPWWNWGSECFTSSALTPFSALMLQCTIYTELIIV